MDLKSVIHMELEKNGRSYCFSMPFGAPYGECYDVLFECVSKILELSKTAAEQAKRKEEQD